MRKLATLTVVGIIAVLALANGASATTTEVRTAEEAAAKLPAAASVQQAEANQAAVAPSVKAAIAAGHGRELLATTTSPDVRADLLRYGQVTEVHSPFSRFEKPANAPTGVAARRHVRAHAAGCYGSPWSVRQLLVAGLQVAYVFIRENGWCGEQGGQNRITYLSTPTYINWTWGPYCTTNYGTDFSWDYWPTWVHGFTKDTIGVPYPWGCWGIRGIKAVLRINAGGYWDTYDDYGF
jgi:hypothetical protein